MKELLRCEGCGLPPTYCICAELSPVPLATQVVVVMHRNERLKLTNTGRLTLRLLAGSQVRVRGLLTSDADDSAKPLPQGRRLVLFPGTAARPLDERDRSYHNVLLVPDGTWSQARKLVQRDPLLAEGEWVRVPECESEYRLRRNRREGGLCTLEAIAHALAILEENQEAASHVLDGFERFQRRAASIQHHGVEGLPDSRWWTNAPRSKASCSG